METYEIKEKFNQFINKDNMNIIYKSEISESTYNKILDNIYKSGINRLKINKDDTPLQKIKEIARQYASIEFEQNKELQGFYIHNKLYINDLLPESIQITTIIHELTHQIYAELFEQIIKLLTDEKDEYVIQSFIMFMLNNSIENRAATEYLSYIIEARYTPSEYQNYLSFIQLLIELNIDVDHSKQYFIYAHELSHDLQLIFNKLIDDDIKNEIEMQFKEDNIEKYNQELKFDYSNERFNTTEKLEIINEMILFIFDYFINGDGDIDELVDNYKLIIN